MDRIFMRSLHSFGFIFKSNSSESQRFVQKKRRKYINTKIHDLRSTVSWEIATIGLCLICDNLHTLFCLKKDKW